jgi:hypothetical protein
MARKAKAAVLGSDLLGTDANDTFILHGDGLRTISGFDPAHDRVMFDVNHSYSDIITLDKPYDGMELDTWGGAHLSVHALDYNGDGIMDTQVSLSGIDGTATAVLLSVDPDSLYGWNLAGG